MNLNNQEQLEKAQAESIAEGDATAFLMAEHDWLRSALLEMKATVGRKEFEPLQASLSSISERLDLHIRKEEEVFFPAIEPQMLEAGQGSTFDMYGEHDAIRIRRDQLVRALASQADIAGSFAAFERSITIHFENEEDLIFADAPGWLTKEQGSDLIQKMQALA